MTSKSRKRRIVLRGIRNMMKQVVTDPVELKLESQKLYKMLRQVGFFKKNFKQLID